VITGDRGVVVAYDIAVPAGQGGVADVVSGSDGTATRGHNRVVVDALVEVTSAMAVFAVVIIPIVVSVDAVIPAVIPVAVIPRSCRSWSND